MNYNTLADFRRTLYACFQYAGDALMNVVDALLTHTPAKSLVELTLSPFFTRQWPSLYEAFQDAKIDRGALQQLFVQYAPQPSPTERRRLGGDASSILRVESKTAQDRTYVHASNLPKGAKPVRPGGQFSPRAVLPRVTRHGAADTKRDPKESWFVFRGQALPPLAQIPKRYARRYRLEHGYRVDKQDLLWETPRLRTPTQFENGTDLVACVRNQLFLARDLAGNLRQPWESKERACTPQQVRGKRDFCRLYSSEPL